MTGPAHLKQALALIALLCAAAAGAQAPPSDISIQQRMIVFESDGSTLRVNELYKVQNAAPGGAATQRRFEIYLPEGAAVEQAAARSGGGASVKTAIVPQKDKNRYAFTNPVRPGQTQFTITYNLPYSGQLKINPRITAATAQLMVIAPDTMRLAPESNSALLPTDDPLLKNVIVYVASGLTPRSNVGLEVQGSGHLARPQKQAPPASTARSVSPEASAPRKAGDVREGQARTAHAQWIFLLVLLLFLAAAAVYIYSANHAAPPVSPAPPGSSLLAEMKEEMFQLESDRLQGKLSPEEYDTAKAALDRTMQKIL